jgi:phosphoribosylformimino-5-aminoimidazole carboxamide ribotide isomerase
MIVYPVLDILDGVVVRGVAGRRKEYHPVKSRLTDSADPLDVARAFRDELGLERLYLADLDSICGRHAHAGVIAALSEDGFELLVDVGLRNSHEAEWLLEAGATALVAGLETIPGPELLETLCNEYGSEQVIFSLDLAAGEPLGRVETWPSPEPVAIAAEAVARGVRRIIVLDLARVGVREGIGTLELCHELVERFPDVEWIAGGGIRNTGDLQQARQAGLHGVLIATALHERTIGREDIESL